MSIVKKKLLEHEQKRIEGIQVAMLNSLDGLELLIGETRKLIKERFEDKNLHYLYMHEGDNLQNLAENYKIGARMYNMYVEALLGRVNHDDVR